MVDKSSILKEKKLGLFFTLGISLKRWHELGMLDREISIYNELSEYYEHIYFFTYGDHTDFKFKEYLADNISIIPKKYISNPFLYSFLFPIIHRKILKEINFVKTNQMLGSWSAVLSKIINKNILVVRTGYVLSLGFIDNKNWLKKKIVGIIEKLAYNQSNGIITSSNEGFNYVKHRYNPNGIHCMIPNFVNTNLFRPLNIPKNKGSICFVGRLNKQKNLFALIEAIEGNPYSLSIIGSGELKEALKRFSSEKKVDVNFLGNMPNKDLPKILNQHEIFILPSLWEGMPKVLLEAMACGLPVIATNVKGNKEVLLNQENGILCGTDFLSIKKSIINLMENKDLKLKLGKNARETIIRSYSLENLVKKEVKLMEMLID